MTGDQVGCVGSGGGPSFLCNTLFTQFNGSYGNYDGFQRNGLANSTLYLLMWLAI